MNPLVKGRTVWKVLGYSSKNQFFDSPFKKEEAVSRCESRQKADVLQPEGFGQKRIERKRCNVFM